ncbi:MAG: VWA-like domain-containing protein [Desulfurococcaceae archaeon]
MVPVLEEEFGRLLAALSLVDPLLGMFVRRTWVYLSGGVDVAATDGLSIYVSPRFFELEPRRRLFLIAHLAAHIALNHPARARRLVGLGLEPAAVAAACDVKANLALRGSELYDEEAARELTVAPEGLEGAEVDAERASVEELAEALARLVAAGSGCPLARGSDLLLQPAPVDGVLVRGDEEDLTSPDAEGRVREKLLEAYGAARAAGAEPGFLARIVEELLLPRVHWRALLRLQLEGAGRSVRRSWARPSRKHPELPGRRTLSRGRVVAAVDVSGSVSDEELRAFLSEVCGLAGEAHEVVVVPWDAKVRGAVRVRGPGDVRRVARRGFTGGGGTVLGPALEFIDRHFPDAVAVVILSDWRISDLRSAEPWLRRNAHRVVAITTGERPPSYLRSARLRW